MPVREAIQTVKRRYHTTRNISRTPEHSSMGRPRSPSKWQAWMVVISLSQLKK